MPFEITLSVKVDLATVEEAEALAQKLAAGLSEKVGPSEYHSVWRVSAAEMKPPRATGRKK